MVAVHRNVSEILKGSLPYLAGGIVNSIAPFVVSLLVSRYLGKDALGLFSVCFALVLAGILVSDLGLNSLIVREFAGSREPESMNLRTLLLVRLVVSIVTGMGIVFATRIFAPSRDILVLGSTAYALIVLRSVAGTLENVLKARMHRATFTTVTIAGSTAHGVLAYVVLDSGYGIEQVFLAMVAVEAAKALLLLWIDRREIRPAVSKAALTRPALLRLFGQGLPFALIGVFTLINERSALFFLSKICGNGEAGIYSAADRFLIIGTLVDSSLFASAFPILSLFGTDPQFHRVTRQTLSITFSVGIFAALLLFAGAPWLIGLSFRFPESVNLLRILCLSLPALLLSSILRIALFSMHYERSVSTAFGITCVVNVVLNLLVVPRFASTGAAVVSVFTEYGTAALYGFLYLRSMSRHPGRLQEAMS